MVSEVLLEKNGPFCPFGQSSIKKQRVLIAQNLKDYSNVELTRPLGNALEDSYKATRMLALSSLKAMKKNKRAAAYLARAAVTAKKRKFRVKAHRAAFEVEKEHARKLYEAVAGARINPSYRVRALEYIVDLGSIDSVPGMILVTEIITSDIRVQFARSKGIKQVPVRINGASLQIELPELDLVAVNTSISVLRNLQSRSISVLKSLSGKDFGKNTKAWKNWWTSR